MKRKRARRSGRKNGASADAIIFSGTASRKVMWFKEHMAEVTKNILVDCINGYLAECEAAKRFPFSNNEITRNPNLTWYDK